MAIESDSDGSGILTIFIQTINVCWVRYHQTISSGLSGSVIGYY